MNADITGDLSNRTAALEDESYRLLLVLRRKCAACRTHFSLSRRIGQLSRVSTEAGTVQNGRRLSGVDAARCCCRRSMTWSITVILSRRAYSPVLGQSDLLPTPPSRPAVQQTVASRSSCVPSRDIS